MSVVVNVLCRQASWVAFDGRAIRNNQITFESTEKALMVNDTVCVGYTGTLELAQLVIQNLKQNVTGIENAPSEIVARLIETMLLKLNAPKDMEYYFLITGKNSNGVLASYTLGINQKLRTYVPAEGEFMTTVLRSEDNTLDVNPYVIKHIKKSGFSNIAIKNALQEYIRDVSQVDHSVNSYCRVIELRNSPNTV